VITTIHDNIVVQNEQKCRPVPVHILAAFCLERSPGHAHKWLDMLTAPTRGCAPAPTVCLCTARAQKHSACFRRGAAANATNPPPRHAITHKSAPLISFLLMLSALSTSPQNWNPELCSFLSISNSHQLKPGTSANG
jgi:hypothetical protein